MEKILVFATSYLDELITHPKEEGKGRRLLDDLAAGSGGKIAVEYRCDRDMRDPMTPEELVRTAALISDLELYAPELLEKVGAANGGPLKLLSRYGVGYDAVDLEAATRSGVMVTNCPGCNSLPTAELTVMTILDVAGRRIPHYETASQGKSKVGPSRLDVTGKKLGIIGTGSIGKHVFELMKGYNISGVAYDPYPDTRWAAQVNMQYLDSPEKVCEQADIITLHAASNDTIITQKQIASMRPTTVLINCARRHLVDNEAVYHAVKQGKIWGYGMDEIWDLNLSLEGLNIVVSPHVGSDTDMGKIGMQVMSAQAIVDYMQGIRPRYVVNKDVLDSPVHGHLKEID
jgi:phosphoglycerate dehydrogenase-like enzyme